MSSIFVGENNCSEDIEILLKRRGLDCFNSININGIVHSSGALVVNDHVQHSISINFYVFQYDGELFDYSTKDNLNIKKILKLLILNELENEKLIESLYNHLNEFENEFSVALTIGRKVYFFTDEIGRKSLGMIRSPFSLCSVKYNEDVDNTLFYCYDFDKKELFKWPKKNNIFLVKLNSNPVSDFKLELEHIDRIDNLFRHVASEKIKYVKTPVVFFSGGVDSMILTVYIHLELDPNQSIYLINSAFPYSFDRINGIKSHAELSQRFPQRKFVLIQNDLHVEEINEHSSKIIELISPKTKFMDYNIGAILYFTAKEASKYGKTVFLGSGADEIFCGYNRYKESEFESFRTSMLNDLVNIAKNNIFRDDRVISNWNVEPRFIFLSNILIMESLNLPDCCFLSKDENHIENKVILRKLLRKYELKSAASIPKKAMQFGTGIKKHYESKELKYDNSWKNKEP